MDKQKRQAIKQMILAAFMAAAVVVPGMVAVNAATVKEQAEHAERAKQARAVVQAAKATPQEQPPEVLTYWDGVPLEKELQDYIADKCREYHIAPEVVIAMCEHESSYNEKAIGDDGRSFGLMQVMAKWHVERMTELNCENLLDARQNIAVGIDYLAELLDKYDGDIAKALTAYNRGHHSGTVTQYAKTILATAERLGGANAQILQ